jgi:hypothetical protein
MPQHHLNSISVAEVRKLLASQLPTIDGLDAFCLDHFPEVAKQLSDTMSRTRKENILLQSVAAEEIQASLCSAALPSGLPQLGASRCAGDLQDILKSILSCSDRAAVRVVVVVTEAARAQPRPESAPQDPIRYRQAARKRHGAR